MFPARYAFVTVHRPDRIIGLVLAAGPGTRYGGPKALARDERRTPWAVLATRMLREAGCSAVVVALGSSADEAATLIPLDASIIVVPDWADGLSATLRAGLDAATAARADALVITPVDTPEAPASAAARVIAAVENVRAGLARATYDGAPGHPVLVGSAHYVPLAAALTGDRGAGAYLAAHGALEIECGDLWSGDDVDRR